MGNKTSHHHHHAPPPPSFEERRRNAVAKHEEVKNLLSARLANLASLQQNDESAMNTFHSGIMRQMNDIDAAYRENELDIEKRKKQTLNEFQAMIERLQSDMCTIDERLVVKGAEQAKCETKLVELEKRRKHQEEQLKESEKELKAELQKTSKALDDVQQQATSIMTDLGGPGALVEPAVKSICELLAALNSLPASTYSNTNATRSLGTLVYQMHDYLLSRLSIIKSQLDRLGTAMNAQQKLEWLKQHGVTEQAAAMLPFHKMMELTDEQMMKFFKLNEFTLFVLRSDIQTIQQSDASLKVDIIRTLDEVKGKIDPVLAWQESVAQLHREQSQLSLNQDAVKALV